jgi:predicted ATPase
MIVSENYTIGEVLYRSEKTIIYKGKDLNQETVILKALNHSHPTPGQLAHFQLEYEMVHRFQSEGTTTQITSVIQSQALLKHHNGLMIVMEDIEGSPLDQFRNPETIPLGEFLQLAIGITEIIEQIHRQLVIHKDINPSNIIWNREKGWVRIIDFGLASTLTRECSEIWNRHTLEGTPPYLSPEQTGRMNRSIDFRTDLYSLGCTLTFLLTGAPPFTQKNTLELVHSHLAKTPPPLHHKQTHIPQILSQIILKLLEKEAQNRYQTASGLKKDLKTCLDQWQENATLSPFPLGKFDWVDRFIIPQELFGREKELKQINQAYEQAKQGGVRRLFVQGGAGRGKSSLVHEVSRGIIMDGGLFIAGGSSQTKSDTPYRAIVEAFEKLIEQLLTQSDQQLSRWRESFGTALKAQAPLICRVLPKLQSIIGPQEPIEPLLPQQSWHQLQQAFLEIIKIIGQEKTVLTLFIDDLQWSDQQSLQLLERIMIDPDLNHFLLIITYRDDEVEKNPHLKQFIHAMEKAEISSQTLSLAPLTRSHISHLISRATHSRESEIEPVVKLCMEKTNGNPFFLKQFLLSLYQEDLLVLKEGSWQWKLAGISNKSITENVVDLMVERIKNRSETTQTLLKNAACIGSTFDLSTLAQLLSWTTEQTHQACQEPLIQGLILPKKGEAALSAYLDDPQVTYEFVHDRVHQAAYSLLQEQQRIQIHRQIGQSLLDKNSTLKSTQTLFNMTNHLNIGLSQLSPAERNRVAELNLQAGNQAKLSAAHNSAFTYYDTGLTLLEKTGWCKDYPLTLALHNGAAEMANMAGKYDRLAPIMAAIHGNTHSVLDRVKGEEFRIIANTSAMAFGEALNNGFALLKEMGLQIPQEPPSLAEINQLWAPLNHHIRGNSEDWVLNLPKNSNPHSCSIIRIISALIPPATILGSNWMHYLLIKGIHEIIQNGNTSHSSLIFGDFATLYLCGVQNEIESGYQLGRSSLKLLKKYPNSQIQTRVVFIHIAGVMHWKKHYLKTVLPAYREGIREGWEMRRVSPI